LSAAAAALAYVRATQGERLGHLARLGRLTAADCLTLDETAVETLELLRAADGTVRNSLVGALDETVTPMGARLLRQWLLQPLRGPRSPSSTTCARSWRPRWSTSRPSRWPTAA